MSPLSFIQSHAPLCVDCDNSCPISGEVDNPAVRHNLRLGPTRRKLVAAGRSIFEQGEFSDQFYVVSKGWVCLHVLLQDGRRQNVKFATAGDLIGFGSRPVVEMDHAATAMTEVVLCPIDRRSFLREAQQDSALLMRIIDYLVAEQAQMRTLLITISRMSAIERITYLICEIHLRMFGRLPEDGDRLLLPFTQEQIGDALGLSAVHVCRMLSSLRRDGVAGGRNQLITVKDGERLLAMTGNVEALSALAHPGERAAELAS